MNDERLGLPSSSEMWRLSECSGSKILSDSLRAKGIDLEIPNISATLGERIHSSLEGYNMDLNIRAQEIRDDCDRIANQASREFLGDSVEPEILIEERLWYKKNGIPFFSGRPDRVSIVPEIILDVNFKTGTSEEEDAGSNLQMGSEVVLLHHHYPKITRIGALLSQPLATNQPEIVVYDLQAMEEAEIHILGIVDRATWDKKRRAGPWCKFCPARAFCPEARELANDLPVRLKNDQLPELPSGPEAAEMLERLYIAKGILEAMKEAFSQKISKDPQSIPGWHISSGKRVRSLPPEKELEFLNAALLSGLSEEDIGSSHKFSITAFENLAAKKWSLKGKEFKKKFNKVFGKFFDVRHDDGYLKKIPKRLLLEEEKE